MDNNKKILSPARKLYLKETRRTSAWISFCKIFLIIGLLLLWEIAGSFGWIDPFIMSQPSRILHCIADLYKQGDLIKHIAVSCAETAVGFLLGTCIGTLIATLLWWSPFFSKVLEPYLVILNALPKVALGPIIIVWVGAFAHSPLHCRFV